MKSTKKIFAIGLAAILVLALLAGCAKAPAGTSGGGDNAGQASAGRDDVVYCLTSDVGSLDHIFATDQIANIVWRQLYDTLIEKDENGEWVGKLAESWELSPDGCTYTFHLRQDVVCHDGLPMTAEDVAYSLNREIASAAQGSSMVNMTDAEVVDEYTVKLNLTAPYAPALDVLYAWGRISSARTTDYDTMPIGTGPYKFVSRSSGDNIIMEAWDQYYLGEAAIKDLTFKIITDTTTQIAALQKGEIDFLTHAPLYAKDTVESDENLVWQEHAFKGNIWVAFRTDTPPFDSINARKAVQFCIDKEAMLIGGNEGRGKILKTMWPADITASPEDGFENSYSYDVDKAKEYLEAYKAETGLSTVSVTILAPETQMYLNPAVTLEGLMSAIGFDVTTNQIDRATFWASLQSGTGFQVACAGTSWPVADGDANYMYVHSSGAGGQNYGPYINADIDRLLDQARNSSDLEERRTCYKQVQELVDENAFMVTLYSPNVAVSYTKALKGVDAENNLYQHYVYDWSW